MCVKRENETSWWEFSCAFWLLQVCPSTEIPRKTPYVIADQPQKRQGSTVSCYSACNISINSNNSSNNNAVIIIIQEFLICRKFCPCCKNKIGCMCDIFCKSSFLQLTGCLYPWIPLIWQYLYTVSNNAPSLVCYNFDIRQPILIIVSR